MKNIVIKYLGFFFLALISGSAISQNSEYAGILVVVNSERIFNESNLGKTMLQTLRSEFLQRQNDLKKEAENSPNPSADQLLIAKQNLFKTELNQRTFEERSKIASVANEWLKKYADKFQINIIMQGAAYVKKSSDITNEMLALLNGQKNIEDVTYSGSKNTKVAVVNSEKIFKSAGFASGKSENETEARVRLASSANKILSAIAEKENIDVIVQEAAYVSPAMDITEKVIQGLISNKVIDGASYQMMNESQKIKPSPLSENSKSNTLDSAKIKCSELGFKNGTETFGKCVLRLTNQ